MDTTLIVNNRFIIGSLQLPLLLFLFGCSASPQWHVSHQKSSQEEFDSARLSYPIRDKVNEVSVAMIYAKKNIRTYLEVHSQMIPPHMGNPKEALVKIRTPQETIHGIAHRHQGGQRATLPEDLHTTLINHLLNNTPVTIELVGYSTTLEPRDFIIAYQEMQKAPLNIPIQLPFKL